MKCYYTLFTKDGLVKNIGSYLLSFIILIIISSGIFFYKCGYFFIEEKIREIELKKNQKEKSNLKSKKIKKKKIKKKIKKEK